MTPTDAAPTDAVPSAAGPDAAASPARPGDTVPPGGAVPGPVAVPAGVDAGGPASVHPAADLVQRIGAVVAGAAVVVAAYLWFAPLTVPANKGLPFGCGSPAHPNDQQLGGVVCGTSIGSHRAAAAAAFAVAVFAVIVVLVLRPLARRRWAPPVGLGLLAAAPLLAAAAIALLTEVEVRSGDGSSVFNCGSAVQPVQDAFARGICADVPGSRLAAGIALAVGGVLAAVAVPFVWRRPVPAPAEGA